MKRKNRFETTRNLLETPYGIQFRPQQRESGICADGDQKQMFSPHLDVSKQNPCHTSLMAVPKKLRKSRRLVHFPFFSSCGLLKLVIYTPLKNFFFNVFSNCKRRMAMIQDLYGQVEATSSIMKRAQTVQTYLDARFPSFVKPMIRSIVTKGFWLSLPRLFCELHLPEHDATVILEDENQTEYNTKYLAERRGLSGGWRGFSIAHSLIEGDVLVFHMVRYCKMKVYIIRSDHFAEVDAALCLLHLDAHRTGTSSGQLVSP
ncbi:hypothetical protein M9H77_20390 [Catharanthus roseus]|uniref:Uncharacterized protein n=1 Tax=Catharanthus roseus TaxID=4058 RepID=A0ACC0AM28_CATRO|nr:hypothetical protein M9H77_20390 [Catharanthus roseus]